MVYDFDHFIPTLPNSVSSCRRVGHESIVLEVGDGDLGRCDPGGLSHFQDSDSSDGTKKDNSSLPAKEGPAPIKRLRGRGCFTVAAATASALFGLLLFANGGAGVIHSKDICI